ncbi:hypothetical protein DL766_010124 [Monosporascus sp. MC13-8B]|uniref:DUF7136 domain-containing protein n=1 Tax=Monosporascus cannonballus TaxID=155416 RepID=A0ABY0H1I8_9PEZI|nr:hypothetical protein DL763_009953 [Monosporascus cannonballus]RYO82099.1 hypothetical protein DL762_006786 [Monosporascus cannonballus]RYP10030.1 hypothetical protein DL766_010124 [Monosporascus sp. MC13-8B]
MHLISRAVWSLVGSLAYLGAVVNAAGVLEIDVVFPRNNETYAPTDKFPIVFALQNAELAKHLKPFINSFVRNGSNLESTFGHSHMDLAYANYSSEPYFVYHHLNIDTEGPHELFSTAAWQSCDESGDQVGILGNTTNFSVLFTIKRGGQKVDLVAATANDKTCSAKDGVAINVTDQTREVPASWDRPAGTCAVLASSSPTPTVNPCRVKIDTAVAASMSASLHAALCKGPNPPADCPEENTVQQLAVAGVASVAAAFGAIGFLLA